ncbi:unnamed protein product [Arabidopsis lyrata]|nr:putative disease resistance protein At1g58400 [Arabidopsis lyrata subsp. lyrata]CAH8256740.1 unnamed protein product [Arabidopsis lyrata]|eukprot:XP_020868284.1 putative disease resistance protein At1g58400 [Arabidopsis lyrata subsp. lyrata]
MVDKEMEEMGKQMINHCGGLPLAVKVLGGLLSTKYTLHDWKRLSKNITSHIVGKTDFNDNNDSSVYYVLSLSFEELPIYLKHCFLYLAHFPEDYPINVEKLSYYWAAEGIPKPRYYDGATIRDVADGYIEELVTRNVVIAERDIRTLRFVTFHLHDMMREVCLAKAREENFLQLSVDSSPMAHSQSPCRSRRLVFHGPTKLHITRDIKNPKLRSLLVMSGIRFPHSPVMQETRCMLSSLSFTRLQLLRLLDLSKSKFEGGKLPSSIGNLIHLRYLSLENSMVSHLPYSLRNLKLLIYLNLDVKWDSVIYMPDFFMGMRELRYLSLPWALSKKTKLDLSNLVNLETLKNFLTRNCSFGDLHGMTNFKTLEISFYHGMSVETISSSVGGLRNLENLTIIDHRANRFDANIIKGFVLDCIHLNKLDLKIYMPKLPEVQHFPSHLKTITLTECCLEEDPMPILEKLFQLKEVHLKYQSFCGKRMVCSGNGFPQLQFLSIFELKEWEEWIVEEGSMPLLHTLTIWSCGKLKELPDGMRYITSLKELYIGMMQTEWKERLSERGADFYKVQHIPSVYLQRY